MLLSPLLWVVSDTYRSVKILLAGIRMTFYFSVFVGIAILLNQWEMVLLPVLLLIIGAVIQRSPI